MSTQYPDDPRSTLLARLRDREEQAEFLLNARRLMRRTNRLAAAGLDVAGTLEGVGLLTLPYPGVWTIVDVYEGGRARRATVSHPIPAMQGLVSRLANEWPPARDSRLGVNIFRTGESELFSHVTDDTLRGLRCSPDHLALLRELKIGSVLTVAMQGDDGIIGSLTFVGPQGGHEFDNRDRLLAEDIAAGAAIAIMGARVADGRARDRAAAAINSAERISFMSSLSRGVRTPLHNIFGYAQLLEAGVRGPLSDVQRDDIGRIRENERHLLNLVDAVITFARWDDDGPTALEDVVVRDALERADRDIVAAASMKGVTYDRDHAGVPAHLAVRAEFQRVTEILAQLLENAVKFSRAGGAVDVRAMAVGDCVWIRISDTGIGINDEDIELIFHPLVRGRDTYAREQDGVGIGLAIGRRLARSMGGELSVVSSRGKGSTFTISLPRGRQRLRRPVIRETAPP